MASLAIFAASYSQLRADIPWPEVVQRLAYENEKLARRPQGHDGEYFVVCTLYYTPKESGFTFERGFDATPITKPGLHGRTYPRDFLRSVKKEGFGRIVTPVNGRQYIRYNGGGSFGFASHPDGGGGVLVDRYSAAIKSARAPCVAEPLSRHLLPKCKKSLAALDGRSWIPAAVCAAGKSIAITAKTNRLVPASCRPTAWTTFEYAYADARIVN